MKISDRLSKAFHNFLEKYGDFRHSEYENDKTPNVYWDDGLIFNPLVNEDTKCSTHWFSLRADGSADVVFTFPLHILNKWAVVADDLFDDIERGFNCRIKAYAKSEHSPMEIKELTIDIQAGLQIEESRLLGIAVLLGHATKHSYDSKFLEEMLSLIGSMELHTDEEFEQRLMLAILAEDASYLAKAE